MTRPAAPIEPPVALTIAGSDSGGGAGIQADLKTMEAHGAFGTSAITAVTAQHTRGVTASEVLPSRTVAAQIDAIREDFDVRAAKTGMLAARGVIETVLDGLADASFPLVVDPVMVATSGDPLFDAGDIDAYESLIAQATVVTPNAAEAELLTGIAVTDQATAENAGRALLDAGADAALVKGGHVPGDDVVDVLVTSDGQRTFSNERVETDATHGSGCTLSAAIAARLAHGDGLETAVERAVTHLHRAIAFPVDVGHGPGTVQHLVELRDRAEHTATVDAVAGIVKRFRARDVTALVPEVGMNVVGATPYAATPGDVAAVEGRITRTMDGVDANRGVRMGASSHVARFLLAARTIRPELRYAVNCRFDTDVEAALDVLDGTVAEFDRDVEPSDVKATEGSTMQWGAKRAFSTAADVIAVIDRGEIGKEAIVKLVAPDPDTLVARTFAVLDARA